MYYRHGQCSGGTISSEYRSWDQIKQRCQNPNNKYYKDYGGRGIKVCTRWQIFPNFFEDMGKRPGSEYSIDRIDNGGNYEPDNCHWATPHEQRVNMRPISYGPNKQRFFEATEPDGKTIWVWNNQHEFAREFGLKREHISSCLRGVLKHHHGWQFQRI